MVDQFIAATLLILVGIVTAALISGWSVDLAGERSAAVANTTRQQLSCQYASLYVSEVNWDCNSNCFTGVPHRVNATIKNSGGTKLDMFGAFITMSDGITYRLEGNRTTIGTGGVAVKMYDDILIDSLQKMPLQTFDTRRAYGNDSNTAGLWHLDEGSGAAAADDARSNTGNISGASWTSGRFGGALSFDGGDSVNAGDPSVLDFGTGAFAAEAWFKWGGGGGTQTILRKGSSTAAYFLRITGSSLQFGVGSAVASTAFSDTASWHHAAGVREASGNMALYIDGSLAATSSSAQSVSSGDNFTVGSAQGTDYFTGQIDEVRLSSAARFFNTTLMYTVNHNNIATVRVYDHSGALIDTASAGGASYFSRNLSDVSAAADYRVEVEDGEGARTEKWYPARGGCTARSRLERITFVPANCPEVTDSIRADDITFTGCSP